MRNILARRNAGCLQRFAGKQGLVILDFDGTLSPIVDQPSAAVMRPETARLLGSVVALYPVAILTGRSLDDVGSRLSGIEVAALVGNHGIEPSSAMHDAAQRVNEWMPSLSSDVAGMAGVLLENKRHSVAIHYRHAPSAARAQSAIRDAVRRLSGTPRMVEGKKVVNVVPADAPHKGDALRELRQRFAADATLYVGDDVTDEDAFAAQDPERSLSIRVGRHKGSSARFFIPSQLQIDQLLGTLAALRSGALPDESSTQNSTLNPTCA